MARGGGVRGLEKEREANRLGGEWKIQQPRETERDRSQSLEVDEHEFKM